MAVDVRHKKNFRISLRTIVIFFWALVCLRSPLHLTYIRALSQLCLWTYRGLSIVVVLVIVVVVTVFLLLSGNAGLMSVWGRSQPFVAADELIASRDESARSAVAVETSFAFDVHSHADRRILSPLLWPRFFYHSSAFFPYWNGFSTRSLCYPDRKFQKKKKIRYER